MRKEPLILGLGLLALGLPGLSQARATYDRPINIITSNYDLVDTTYIDRGRLDGVKVGDKFEVKFRDGKLATQVIVTGVFERMASVKIMDSWLLKDGQLANFDQRPMVAALQPKARRPAPDMTVAAKPKAKAAAPKAAAPVSASVAAPAAPAAPSAPAMAPDAPGLEPGMPDSPDMGGLPAGPDAGGLPSDSGLPPGPGADMGLPGGDTGLPPAPGADMGLPGGDGLPPAPGGDMSLPPAPGGDTGLPPAPGDMGLPPDSGGMDIPPPPM